MGLVKTLFFFFFKPLITISTTFIPFVSQCCHKMVSSWLKRLYVVWVVAKLPSNECNDLRHFKLGTKLFSPLMGTSWCSVFLVFPGASSLASLPADARWAALPFQALPQLGQHNRRGWAAVAGHTSSVSEPQVDHLDFTHRVFLAHFFLSNRV